MTKQDSVDVWPNAAIWMRDELRSKVRSLYTEADLVMYKTIMILYITPCIHCCSWHVDAVSRVTWSLIDRAAIEEVTPDECLVIKQWSSSVLSAEDRDLLACYHHGFDDEKVDIDLIICLLYAVHSQPREGCRLLFVCKTHSLLVYISVWRSEFHCRRSTALEQFTASFLHHSDTELREFKRLLKMDLFWVDDTSAHNEL